MSDVLQWEKRNELLSGIVIATTVLVVGYASGLGHLVGRPAPSVPFAVSAPGRQGTGPAPNGAGSAGTGLRVSGGSTVPGTGDGSARGQNGAPTSGQTGTASPVAAGTDCDAALLSAIAQPFWAHLRKGHLEESPGQQAGDILNTDQYIKTHTVLIADMLTPAYIAASHASDAASTFWMHFKHGHLDEAPGQQAGDILNTDQYVTTHTVLVEDMLAPTASTATGTC